MKKIKVFLSLVLSLVTISLSAQNVTVKGTVSDASGAPLPGAAVAILGTTQGVVTGLDGQYSITAPSNAVLSVSFFGYVTVEENVAGRTSIDFVLQEDATNLDEVIVVAYGTATKSSFTGSASVVKSEEIEKQISSNVTTALAGTTPGVQVISSNGDPTSNAPTIRIRGIGSMSASTAPLIVVDGVPYDGAINDINPNDVESMSVLKDAAASAIYGHRGANGVVIITTKRGKAGDAQVKFDSRFGSNSRLIPQYDVITDPAQYYETHFQLMYNKYLYSGGYDENTAYSAACANLFNADNGGLGYLVYTVPEGEQLIGRNFKLNPNATLGYSDGTYYYTPDNWYNETFHNSFRQEYNVSVSGSSDRFTYFASAGYLNDGGIVVNSDYKRFTARVNAEYQAKKWMRMLTSVNFSHSDSQKPNYSSTYGSSGNLFYIVNSIAPIYPLYVRDAETKEIMMQDGRKVFDANQTGFKRPAIVGNAVRDNLYDKNLSNADVLNGKFGIVLTPVKGLTLNANVNTFVDNTRSNYLGSKFASSAASDGYVEVDNSRYFTVNQQYLAEYKTSFAENHHVDVLAGYEQFNRTVQSSYGVNDHLFDPDNIELGNALGKDNIKTSSSANKYMTEGFLARVQYDYDGKYFASASFRRDASSRFAPENRWGNFWSASTAWLLNKEEFMADAEFINLLKLKASYGATGNDNIGGYYPYADQYSTKYDEKTGEYSISLSYKGNRNLTWEKINSFNVGVDFELFNGYLNGGFEFFSRITTDLLYSKSVPLSAGNPTGSTPINIGSISNNGFELNLDGTILRSRNVNWTWNMNMTHYTNKILELDPDTPVITGGNYIYQAGGSLYNAYLRKFAGVNPETGAAQYWKSQDLLDEDNNPVKDADGKVMKEDVITEKFSEATQYDLGSVLPKLYGGFGTSVTAYGFDFSVQFSYQLGGKYYDGTYQSLMLTQSNAGQNYHKDLLNAWTPENNKSNVPRLDGDYAVAQTAVDRFLISSNYLSVNNVTLGYTLPKVLTEKMDIAALRVYVAGENLAVISARKGVDPRYSMGLGSYTSGSGLNSGSYSAMRNITAGISLTF